jgi:hypothetical protein
VKIRLNQELDQLYHYQRFYIDIYYSYVLVQVDVEYKYEYVVVRVEEMERKMWLNDDWLMMHAIIHLNMIVN